MQEFELLTGIDNREILIEVLHHSIDYLIGNRDDQQSIRMCHKYGFQNPDDFLFVTRTLAKYYRNCCTENADNELYPKFSSLSPELSRLLPVVLDARRPEVMAYLGRCEYARDYPLVKSFAWDTRLIIGDNFSRNTRQLTTLTLHCWQPNTKNKVLFFEMDKDKLCKMISVLEQAVNNQNSQSN